jgi:hypothetical protein
MHHTFKVRRPSSIAKQDSPNASIGPERLGCNSLANVNLFLVSDLRGFWADPHLADPSLFFCMGLYEHRSTGKKKGDKSTTPQANESSTRFPDVDAANERIIPKSDSTDCHKTFTINIPRTATMSTSPPTVRRSKRMRFARAACIGRHYELS